LVGTLPCQLEALDFGIEPRPKDRRVHWVLKAIADESRIIVFDVHIEFADVREKEGHNLAVIEKLPTRQHDVIRAFLIELAQPMRFFCLGPSYFRIVLFLFSRVKPRMMNPTRLACWSIYGTLAGK
jgi:hypothetical protein